MTTKVASISLKRIAKQVVGLDNTPEFYLDDTGHEIDVFRDSELRSRREVWRSLIGAAGTNLFLRTASGLAIEAVRASSATTAADIINAVRDAIVTGVAGDLANRAAAASKAPATSLKAVLASLSVVLSDGKVALDTVGGTNAIGLFRLPTSRSARQNFRRLLALNSDSATLRMNTLVGVITRQIAADAPATAAALLSSIDAAVFTTTSTTSTALAALPAKARATSLLNQLSQLLVVASDATVALDDTGETTLTRTNQKRSVLGVTEALVDSNADTQQTFRLQTTSGKKWAKVAALNPGTASVADIVAALTNAA